MTSMDRESVNDIVVSKREGGVVAYLKFGIPY
jgi:hypothetical protein